MREIAHASTQRAPLPPPSSLPRMPGRHRPTVLLACDSAEPSGVARHMVTLAAGFGRQVRPLLVFADTPQGGAAVRSAKAREVPACVLPHEDMAAGGAAFSALLRHFLPDIVHVHAGIGWEGHALAATARAWGAGAVVRTEHLPYTLRSLKNPALEAAYARGLEPVDRIICVCRAARETFRMSGLDQRRFTVVYNGIEPQSAARTREATRTALGIGNAPLILTVARFTAQKRHITLIEALPRLLRSQPDARLAWVGSGPLEPELRARAQELHVGQHILFLGECADIADLMAAADAFCLPSYFEGHPLVLLEAMAAGLPVVAARSLGITEAVYDGETGLLYPYDNAPMLAHTLDRLLSDPDLAACLASAAQDTAGQLFMAPRMARDTLAVYRDVLRDHAWMERAVFDTRPG